MANLSTKIKFYCEANSKVANLGLGGNVVVQDNSDGNGPYIKSWSIDGLAQPNDSQLNAVESQANTLESNKQVISTRKSLYGATEEQFEYLVENGVDAFIAKQNQIKSDNPKE